MLKLHRILVPTDFSDRSVAAFQFACSLARDHHSRLIVLHVDPMTSSLRGELEAKLWEQLLAIRPEDPDLAVEHRMHRATPPRRSSRLPLRLHATSSSWLLMAGPV